MLDARAWGKLTRDEAGNEIGRLDLISHSADVAAVVAAFLQLPSIRRRLTRLAGRELSTLDCVRLVVLAFWHDLGKTSLGFQSKSLAKANWIAWLFRVGIDRSECGHTTQIGPLFCDPQLRKRFRQCFPLDALFEWDPELTLLFAAVSHHGTPLRFTDLCSKSRAVWKEDAGYDPWTSLAELGAQAKRWFPKAFETGTAAAPLPDAAAFVHAFAGLVSLADWVGSNTEASFFPYDLAPPDQRWPVAQMRAREVLRAMRMDAEAMRSALHHRAPTFAEIFRDPQTDKPYQPTAIQKLMGDLELGPIVVVEAETGSGKTEAALWRFKTLFESGEVDSLAFVLPTRVSAKQIEGRVARFMQALFPEQEHRPNVVLAIPGYLRVDGIDAIERLPDWQVLWPDSDSERNASIRWAAENCKRYLAAACAVGTVDQVLLSGLQVRHAHLRGFSLLRSLLVVDEVHASDTYMSRVMQMILARQHSAGGHALLLSATLGTRARQQMIFPDEDTAQGADNADRLAAPYPAVTDAQGTQPVARSAPAKDITIELQPSMDDAEAIAKLAAEAVEHGARVLVVRNTVRDVLDVQRALEARLGGHHPALFRCNGVTCPHHGRYAPEDRIRLDAEIERYFGKQAPSQPCVLCGSQTLEQSLDIDADLLITDLAPIDVLLQRMGRLHRHPARRRPTGSTKPRCIVLTPTERDLAPFLKRRGGGNRHGLGGLVYENLLSINATWAELEARKHITVPNDNRILVERCTDAERLQEQAFSAGEAWQTHWIELEGRQRGQAQEAWNRQLDWNEPWDQIAFPGKEERVRTRLGADAVRVPLSHSWTSPFCQTINELRIPAWMWPENVDVQEAEQISQDDRVILCVAGKAFTYSRFGLEVTDWLISG